MAPITLPALQQNRKQVLYLAHLLCALALFLSCVSFWGGFAHTNILSKLSWVTVHSAKGTGYAGVKWVCWDLPVAPAEGTFGESSGGVIETGTGSFWRCETWAEFDCAKSPTGQHECESCQQQAEKIMFSVFMAAGGFYAFYSKTKHREDGDDSNFTKFMACFSALFGGTNFLIAMLTFRYSCVVGAEGMNLDVHSGPGLICMCIAALLKVLMGLVHLGLPVEPSSSKKVDV